MDRFAPIVSDSIFTTSTLFVRSVNAGVIQTQPMQTRFDDPDIVRLIRSIPFRKRIGFVENAVGEWKIWLICYQHLFPPIICCMLAGMAWGRIAVFATVAVLLPISTLILVVRRNKLIRQYLESTIVNGKLPLCPICQASQDDNNGLHCECGCVVEPFAPHL